MNHFIIKSNKMPKCKNDPGRTYKGTEPSPKGLGYCAHTSEDGSMRVGGDGTIWMVKSTKNGIKRWVRSKDNYEYLKYTSVRYNKKKDKRFFCKWDGSKCIDEMKYLKLVLEAELRVMLEQIEIDDPHLSWFVHFYYNCCWEANLPEGFQESWEKEAKEQLKKFIKEEYRYRDLPFYYEAEFPVDFNKYQSEHLEDFDPWNEMKPDTEQRLEWFMDDYREEIKKMWLDMLNKKMK